MSTSIPPPPFTVTDTWLLEDVQVTCMALSQSSERGCSGSPAPPPPPPSARMLQKKMTCETKLERHPVTIRESGEREACGRHGTGPKGPTLTG